MVVRRTKNISCHLGRPKSHPKHFARPDHLSDAATPVTAVHWRRAARSIEVQGNDWSYLKVQKVIIARSIRFWIAIPTECWIHHFLNILNILTFSNQIKWGTTVALIPFQIFVRSDNAVKYITLTCTEYMKLSTALWNIWQRELWRLSKHVWFISGSTSSRLYYTTFTFCVKLGSPQYNAEGAYYQVTHMIRVSQLPHPTSCSKIWANWHIKLRRPSCLFNISQAEHGFIHQSAPHNVRTRHAQEEWDFQLSWEQEPLEFSW